MPEPVAPSASSVVLGLSSGRVDVQKSQSGAFLLKDIIPVFSCPCRGTALVNFAKPEDADKVVSSVRKAGEGVDLESLKIERIDVVTLTDGSRVNHYYVEA